MQPIAQVVEASLEDYEIGLKACEEAAKTWMQVYWLNCKALEYISKQNS